MGCVNCIESCSCVDGPGLRTVVFLQECHLRCKYCHNPEMFLKKSDNETPEELVKKLIKNKPYFKNGGGVTFSGGEPLLQTEFLEECIKSLKKENIHVAVDTAGITNKDYKKVLKLTDLLLFDVKHTNKEGFISLTAGNYDLAINFRDYLKKTQNKIWLRQVIVPGIHDNKEYLISLKNYVEGLNIERIDFLPFIDLSKNKYKELKLEYPMEGIKPMDAEVCKKLCEEFIKIR